MRSSADLRTSACCDAEAVPEWLRPLLARLHPEVTSRYYGCGLVCPPLLEGCRVLDLGCGAGRDVYLLSQLVGPSGSVIGVDMTLEQLEVARRHQSHHAASFGFDNVRFLEGTIENLEALPLDPASFDVIVSNCVVNLSTDKAAVLQGVRRLLCPGGEFYFSDVYADRRLAPELRSHPVLYGECLGGALYWPDLLRLARQAGFPDPRVVAHQPVEVTDGALASLLGEARFRSVTLRLFALEGLEETCEVHGQAVIYRGTVPDHPHRFWLDGGHALETGRVFPLCGNSFRMIAETRLAPHFSLIGDASRHFGPFPGCVGRSPFDGPRSSLAATDPVSAISAVPAVSATSSSSGGCC